jgi:hypothetical protein
MIAVIANDLEVERDDHLEIETGDVNQDPGQETEKEGKSLITIEFLF